MSGEPIRAYAIRNGLIVDGRGGDPFPGDVVIRGGKIVDVAPTSVTDVDVSIDATGLVVSPGFVDVHTHADLLAFATSEDEALRRGAVLQGVTTTIAGNCGFSVFPVPPDGRAEAVGQHLAALFGEGVRTFADLRSYAAEVLRVGLDSNLATLVGQGTLRAAVIGFEPRPASESEIGRMRALIRESLDEGALGLSTGLLYPPGSYADTDEIVEIVSELSGTDRLYVTHMRSEMDRVDQALQEAIEIGRRASVGVQISHLKSAGRRNHGKVAELLRTIEESADSGLDIWADAYPYERGSTVLHALLPPWATEGGIEATIDRLEDSEVRQRLRSDFADSPSGWQNFIEGGSWDDVIVASAPRNRELEGRSIAEAASLGGWDPIDLVADLLISERGIVTVVVAMADEGDVTTCLSSPRVMVGSDGIPTPGKPHPRWAGSFARMLSREQRGRFGLSLSKVVHKLSGLPARRFGLEGRGTIETGNIADLVVFDEEEVRDAATYREPLKPPFGVHHVFVGGRHVVSDGIDTGIRAGHIVRAGGA